MRRVTKLDIARLFEVLVALFAIRFVILALTLVFLVPKQEPTKAEIENRDRGNIRVEVFWPDNADMDIDLWVKTPDDSNAIGWKRQNGRTANLLRDDLGMLNSFSGIHYELIYVREASMGEYIVNVHMFDNKELTWPAPITVIVTHTTVDNGKGQQKVIYQTKTTLDEQKEEKTVVRFTLNSKKELIKDSLNQIKKSIIFQ